MILKEIQKSLIVALAVAFPLFFSSLSTNAANPDALRQLGEQVFGTKSPIHRAWHALLAMTRGLAGRDRIPRPTLLK
ncbi:hypothetical protein [Nitrosomonas communis]|uniref:hypothetical protein n=2 Tax=Nitrosomonadaceae TaxID=206379 RepID=UPI0016532850